MANEITFGGDWDRRMFNRNGWLAVWELIESESIM